MSDDDNTPRHVPREYTVGTLLALAEQRIGRAEADLDKLRSSIEARLKEGTRTFEEMRGELARLREQLEGRVSARVTTVLDHTASVRADLEARIRAVAEGLEALSKEVAPRATPLRIVAWIAGLIGVIGSPIGSAIYFSASAPDRAEVREVEARLRTLEMRTTTLEARITVQGGRP